MKVRHEYIPMKRRYKQRKGLSERQIKKRLEEQGWLVWRGGSINITRHNEVYPNVRRKYELLNKLLTRKHPGIVELLQYYCTVHHGMPDFICHRYGEFKFVECKLGHEQLSPRQQKCILRLQELGLDVEVHKFVDHCTKVRVAMIDYENGSKSIIEKQMTLKNRWLVNSC